ncbi:transmembrane protein 248-like isoform X2 [Babylonia areolata]|uniref:transmembrane protein 248-like isoform X2 n=1 Tax=Babylonia areolata TaxID=304850 RepID=UPI003FCEFF58
MTITIIENVRGYFGSRPPLVMCMIFLGSMAVGLITFAYFVSDMPKTIVDQEFNKFMERLSALNLCVGDERGGGVVGGGGSSLANGSQPAVALGLGRMRYVERMRQADSYVFRDQQHGKLVTSVMTSPPSAATRSSVVNVTTTMVLEIAASSGLLSMATLHNWTSVSATVWASQLGRAEYGQDMEANVTMVLPPLGNHSRPCLTGHRGRCFRVMSCVTLTAPRHFFPPTQRPDAMDKCHRDPELGAENHLHGEVVFASERCANASLIQLQLMYDSAHHALIDMDRSAMNLHLMHSSYFLFVMVISLFCYAIIKGRPPKVKVIHTQCPSDKV